MKSLCKGLPFLLLLPAFFCCAQTFRKPIAANYPGLGACSMRHVDVFSFTENPAALSQVKNVSAGVYGERRYLVTGLNHYVLVAGLPTTTGNFGFVTNYSGFVDYNETRFGLAYGRKLGDKLDIGARFDYNAIRIAGYGNASTISFELGTILHIDDHLHTGFHVINPVGGKFGKEQAEKLSSVFSLSLGYDASEKFLVSAEIEKEEGQPANVMAGMEYKFLPQFLARAGMTSSVSTAWLGLGFTLRTFRLDLTAAYHPQLGISPGLLLLFNFKNSKD